MSLTTLIYVAFTYGLHLVICNKVLLSTSQLTQNYSSGTPSQCKCVFVESLAGDTLQSSHLSFSFSISAPKKTLVNLVFDNALLRTVSFFSETLFSLILSPSSCLNSGYFCPSFDMARIPDLANRPDLYRQK